MHSAERSACDHQSDPAGRKAASAVRRLRFRGENRRKIYYGITNIGVKPTVQEKFTGVETNLFDCSEDLYGKQAEVSLLKFLRPEQKFASIDALKNQLDHDVAAGKKYVEKKFAQQ